MKMINKCILLMSVLILTLTNVGCGKKGSAEKLGKKIDKTYKKAAKQVEKAYNKAKEKLD